MKKLSILALCFVAFSFNLNLFAAEGEPPILIDHKDELKVTLPTQENTDSTNTPAAQTKIKNASIEEPFVLADRQPPDENQTVINPKQFVENRKNIKANSNLKKHLISSENAPLGKNDSKAVDLAKQWMNRTILPSTKSKDGAVVYSFGETMPSVVCQPLRVCAIQLQSNEVIIDAPQCGDIAQWEITTTIKGVGDRPAHIYVKPLDSGLITDIIIVTNKRTYIIELKSRNDGYTPMISFRYPEEEQRNLEQQFAEQKAVTEENERNKQITVGSLQFNANMLDFNYTINGDAKWCPTRVFNYEGKTYLKMPSVMKMYEAPVLLAVNDGQESIVNYRLHDEMYIVDQVFEKAVLISGVGDDQRRITIEHN